MLVRQHAMHLSAAIRHAIDGVTRVVVARTDGVAFHDDGPEEDRENAADLAAAVLDLGRVAGRAYGLGGPVATTLRGPEGCLVTYEVDGLHVLGVVTEPTVNLVLLDRVVRRELLVVAPGTASAAPTHRA